MPRSRVRRTMKQIKIDGILEELNEFAVEPVSTARCVKFLELVIELGYLYGTNRRVMAVRFVQRLLNATLDTDTFCSRISVLMEVNLVPQFINFMNTTLHDVRMEFYMGRANLRGIRLPPGRAVGILRSPKPQRFPAPIVEDFRDIDNPIIRRECRNHIPVPPLNNDSE